jgi:hypothetical protein
MWQLKLYELNWSCRMPSHEQKSYHINMRTIQKLHDRSYESVPSMMNKGKLLSLCQRDERNITRHKRIETMRRTYKVIHLINSTLYYFEITGKSIREYVDVLSLDFF